MNKVLCRVVTCGHGWPVMAAVCLALLPSMCGEGTHPFMCVPSLVTKRGHDGTHPHTLTLTRQSALRSTHPMCVPKTNTYSRSISAFPRPWASAPLHTSAFQYFGECLHRSLRQLLADLCSNKPVKKLNFFSHTNTLG